MAFLGAELSPTTSQKHNRFNSGDSRIILFSGSSCGSECYNSSNPSNQCVWFALGEDGLSYSDLSRLRTTFKKEVCKMIGVKDDKISHCTYLDTNISWQNEITSVYLSDPHLVVVFWDEPNFQGNSFRVWGEGCYDLSRRGWSNRAKSFKVYFQ